MPVAIDDSASAVYPGLGISNGHPAASGPFVYGTDLFIVLRVGTFPTFGAEMYKSSDNGSTWAVVDTGNCVANGNFGCDFDGAATIRIASTTGNGFSTFGQINVQDFDLVTETWGGVTNGGPDVTMVYALAFLDGGDSLIVCNELNGASSGSAYNATIYTGSFGTTFDVAANATAAFPKAGAINASGFTLVVEPGGLVVHAMFNHFYGAAPTFGLVCYQQISNTGSLGTFVSFGPGGDFDPTDFLGTVTTPIPIGVFGDNVIIAYSQTATRELSLYVGTPLSAPVFSQFSSIDPGFPTDADLLTSYNGYPKVFGGVLYLIYIVDGVGSSNTFTRLRLLTQTDDINPGVGWTGATVFDGDVDGGPGWVSNTLISPQVSADISGAPFYSVNSESGTSGQIITFVLRDGGVTVLRNTFE